MIYTSGRYVSTMLFAASFFVYAHVNGQNPLSQETQVEVGIGFATPLLQSGVELMRSEELRDQGSSYFESSQGDRKNVGSYTSLKGYSFNIGFYKPLRKINGLMLGAMVRNTQTGSAPDDGYPEAYFFNFITAGVALKYYPFENINLFGKADFGLAAVSINKTRAKRRTSEAGAPKPI